MRRTAKLGFFFQTSSIVQNGSFSYGRSQRSIGLFGSTVSKHGCGVTLFWVSQHTLKTLQSFRNTRKLKKKNEV